MSYEPLYVAYLVYFNRDRDYFECHEVLEELWLERDHDPLYKGLLQVAVGLFHARSGNVSGGRKCCCRRWSGSARIRKGRWGSTWASCAGRRRLMRKLWSPAKSVFCVL
ncbi:hypothetical protein HMSSN036_63130 [Paenibacillus macerans]|nr:hypothetical protein HMSSN036_63130 [Paenibacillus macerans]